MKTLTVFVLCIVAAYSATDLFAEIKTTDFGKTLTNTIELQLKSKDNIAHVVSMVKEVRKGLRNEAEAAAADYEVVADACRAEMDSMDRKTDALEATVTKNERLEMIDAPVLADRKTEQSNRQTELGQRTAMLEALGDENDRLVESFNAAVAEHAAVRTMMHQARSIIEEAFTSESEAAFLQVKTSAMSKLSSHIRAFKPLAEQGLSHGYAQIFNVIAMIAERAPTVANQGMVDTLLRIFDDIEENLETSLAIEREAERQRLEAFATLRGRLNAEIAKLNARIADLGRECLNLSLAVSNYQENVAGATAQLEDIATLRADKTAQCGAEDAAYSFKNSELQGQITTCGNAIYLMEDKRELLERYQN
jgi:chromosome segregation ATPase